MKKLGGGAGRSHTPNLEYVKLHVVYSIQYRRTKLYTLRLSEYLHILITINNIH